MNRHVKSLIVSAVMIVISIAGATVANATDCGELDGDCFTGVYAGLSVGDATHESADLEPFAVDDNDISAGILVGYRLNKFIGWEVASKYFGKTTYDDTIDVIEGRVCNIGLGVNLYLPLGAVISDSNLDFISIFVKGGGHYWNSELEGVAGPLLGMSYTDDGVDTFYGFGVNIDFARNFALRIEQTIYQAGFDTFPVGDDEITENSLNFIVKF